MAFKHCLAFVFCILLGTTLWAKQDPKHKIDSINTLSFDYKIANTSKVIRLTLENAQNAAKINYDKGLAEAYASLGLLYYYQGKYDKNTMYMLKAIRLFEQQDNKLSLVYAYGDYGYQLKRRNMSQASHYMNKAIKLGGEFLNESQLKEVYDNYGVLKEMQSDLDSALFFYDKALRFKLQLKDELGIPYSLNKIAMVKMLQKKFVEAKKLLDEAYAIRLRRKDKIGIAENLNFYGNYYKLLGNDLQAIHYFEKALKASEKYDYKHLTQENCLELSMLYEKNKDFEAALQYHKKYVHSKDSIQNLEMKSRQAELDIAYETEKKEKEILIQKNDLIVKNSWLLGVFVLLLVSLLVGYLLYNQQKMKNRQLAQEAELREALQYIETQKRLQEQRLEISRDLHDNIGSQLTFIISSIDNLKYAFSIENQLLKNRLSDISSFTRCTIAELRDTIWAMNKDEISLGDLKLRIANFVDHAKIATERVRIDFKSEETLQEEIRFSSLKGINLFRIVQEAVNNSIKHAEASVISIKFAKENDLFCLVLSDNGKGFDTDVTALGNGLYNMKKRASELGGNIAFESVLGRGSEIKVTFS